MGYFTLGYLISRYRSYPPLWIVSSLLLFFFCHIWLWYPALILTYHFVCIYICIKNRLGLVYATQRDGPQNQVVLNKHFFLWHPQTEDKPVSYGKFLHRLNRWCTLMIHRLYRGRLQIGLDKERHTHENLKFLGILLKHVQWSSKSPGPLVVYFKTPLYENVLFRSLMYKSEQNYIFFHARWKIRTKFRQMALGWILSGWKQENLKIFVRL